MRRLLLVRVSAALAAVLLALVGTVGSAEGSPRAGRVAKPQWDPTVRPIATQVERLRGLRFREPVAVRFRDDADFVAEMQRSTARWVRKQRSRLEHDLGILRALGLADADVDVDNAFTATAANDVLAYYDPDTHAITVRGALDARTAPVVAHELAHALQDQHFDLEKVDRAATRTSQQLMADTWVEGDADRVERLFAGTQSRSDQQTAEELEEEAAKALAAANSVSSLPEIYAALQIAPYVLGSPAVTRIIDEGGVRALDEQLGRVPKSDRDAFDPFAVGTREPFGDVPAPALHEGERRDGRVDDLGAVGLYLLLASRIGPTAALDAVDGWAGDRMIAFTRKGTECVRLAVVTTDREARAAMTGALEAVADDLPPGTWTVGRSGSAVEVTGCDPGRQARDPEPYAQAALTLLSVRNEGITAALEAGESTRVAQCVGARLVRDPVITGLATSAELDDTQRDTFWARWRSVVVGCSGLRGEARESPNRDL